VTDTTDPNYEPAKHERVGGEARTALGAQYAERYRNGESIRNIATEAGRSYGAVHQLIREAGADIRGRGGGHGREQAHGTLRKYYAGCRCEICEAAQTPGKLPG
jgi:hypothetical protein